jgi:hypothetical protein
MPKTGFGLGNLPRNQAVPKLALFTVVEPHIDPIVTALLFNVPAKPLKVCGLEINQGQQELHAFSFGRCEKR